MRTAVVPTLLAVAACVSPASAQTRNACRLLTPAEVKQLEASIVMANVIAEEAAYSECQWETSDAAALVLKVHWSGGREQWNHWRRAQGMGEQVLRKEEGIGLDSIVKQGFVPGLGDGAWFSPALPSLLLKGDVLVEITMPTVDAPETKFRSLARTLLGRI